MSRAMDFVDWEAWMERIDNRLFLSFESEEEKEAAYGHYCEYVRETEGDD